MTHELLNEARVSSLKSFTAYCNNSKFREGPQRVSNQLKKDTKHANVTQNSPKRLTFFFYKEAQNEPKMN